MSYSMRLLVVLLTFFLALPVGAEDKPSAKPEDKTPAKPADARRAALVRAGYTHVPLALKPGQLPPGVPVPPAAQSLGFYVDGAVGPEKVRFLLDSGADETMLDLKLAKRLKLELGEEASSAGVGGGSAGRPTYVPGLMIGSYDTRKDRHNVAAEANDLSVWPGVPGVLGTEVLDQYAALVDFPARALYLRPPLTTAWPRLAGTWAVTSWLEDGAARKLDPKAPPTFAFADRRLKLTDGGTTREYAIRLVPEGGVYDLILFDPKQEGKPDPVALAGGLVKVKDGAMTACLALDVKKAKEAPAEFAAPKGSGLVLLELKRTAPDAQKPPADPLRDLLLKDGYTAVRLDREPDGKRMAAARVGRHDLRLVVDTGAAVSTFDTAELGKWGAERLGKLEALAFGGKAKGEKVSLRGLTLGGYDTRRAWSEMYGQGFDLAGLNKALAEQKRQPIQGLLGNLDLLNGSAVIDFGTNTLYLRPAKETVGPELEGKWVGVRYELDGKKGRYAPGDGAVEFKGGRVRFTTPAETKEWGFHLRDEGDRYRVGLFDPKADELADKFTYSGIGLLKLADGTLTLVMEQGRVRKEVTEFAAPNGSGLLLVEYERAK